MSSEDIVRFYRTGDEYGCFSNFWKAPFEFDGATWPTTEHYFQAQKSLDPAEREAIRRAPSAADAARLGRRSKLRDDWNAVRYEVMRSAIRAKFNQHEGLAAVLLATGEREIVEWTIDTPLADSIWGNAPAKDGSPGQNLLGKLLMEVRAELRANREG